MLMFWNWQNRWRTIYRIWFKVNEVFADAFADLEVKLPELQDDFNCNAEY